MGGIVLYPHSRKRRTALARRMYERLTVRQEVIQMADMLTSGHNYRALSMLAEVHKITGELLATGYSENTGHFDPDFIYQCLYCRQRLEHIIQEVGRHENHSK